MNNEMTLREYIAIQRKRLERFEQEYKKGIGNENWPRRLEYQEWIAQDGALFDMLIDERLKKNDI